MSASGFLESLRGTAPRGVITWPVTLRRTFLLALTLALVGCGDQVRVQPDIDARGAPPIDAVVPPRVVRVLFIGNSYTGNNYLPGVVASLGEADQSPVRFDFAQYQLGGQTWEGHDADPAVDAMIAQGWDFVVLQDQSEQPWAVINVKPALISLDAKIRAAGADTVLFMTWARQSLGGEVSEIWQFRQDMAVNRYYVRHAEVVGARVAPVGRAWERALRDGINLYDPDGSHPNARGTYLAGCVFYATLTGENPVGLGDGGLAVTADEMAALQQIAWDTLRARDAPPPPLLGEWSLAVAPMARDFLPGPALVLGDSAGPDASPGSATQFAPGRYAAVPYFTGLNAPVVAVSFDMYRADWSVPTTAVEHIVGKWRGYELTQDGTTLRAQIATVEVLAPPPVAADVAGLTAGWHHVGLTYDATTYRLWIDGVDVANATTTGALRYHDLAPDEPGTFAGIAVGGRPIAAAESVFAGTAPDAFTGRLAGLRITAAATLAGPPPSGTPP